MTMSTTSRIPMRLLLPILMALAPASAQSAAPDRSDLTDLADQELLGLFNRQIAGDAENHCQISALISEMVRRNLSGGIDGYQAEYATRCAIDRQDWAEAYRNMKQWEKLGGDSAPTMEWGFRLAFVAAEYDEALDRLEILARLDDPWQLTSLSDDILFALVQRFNKDDDNDRSMRLYRTLYRSPHFERLSTDIRSISASRMLKMQIETDGAGALGDVGDMLGQISSPYSYIPLLADRLYEPIWPQIEQHAGPNMANILTRNLQERKSGFEAKPDDKEKRQQYGHSLLFSGRFEDVVTLAAAIDHSDAGSQSWNEDDGWMLNLEAYALDALGDTEAADRIFDQFGKIDHRPGENPWLVNFVINRASRLVAQGRWGEGLAASQLAAEVSKDSGSPYANMLVRKARLCALHGLGRSEETQAVMSDIVENQDDALEVAANALLCAGEREQAARMVIKGLEDDKKQAQFIEALQKPAFELFYAASTLPNIHEELGNHPDVAKVFDRLARPVPDDFIPLVGARRKSLAAERASN